MGEPCTVFVQVLHLVGVALLEEQQQLENSSGDDDITFNYTCKITRQYSGKDSPVNNLRTNCQILISQWCCVYCSGPGEAPSTSGSVLALLESLQNAPHLEVHKDMITWILKVNADVTGRLNVFMWKHFHISQKTAEMILDYIKDWNCEFQHRTSVSWQNHDSFLLTFYVSVG